MASTTTAQGPTPDVAQHVSKRRSAPGQTHARLNALPPELRGEVTSRLAPRDIGRLTAVGTQFRVNFAEPARAAWAKVMTLEAQGANLETIDRLLGGPEGIPQLPPHLQAEPRQAVAQQLGALAWEVDTLPGPDQPARFAALLDRVQALGEEKRGTTLTHFAMAMGVVPGLDHDARPGAFLGVVNGLMRLPVDDKSRVTTAALLSRSIRFLPDETHQEAVRQVAEVLRPIPSDMHERVLNLPNEAFHPWVKSKLRKAIAEDQAAALSRAGTSAHP